MADTVNLFGSQVKKGYVIAGGLVVVVAAGYGWYKNKKSGTGTAANAATPATPSAPATGGYAGDPYPPDGTVGNPSDPNSTDPASGQTYGDEAGGFASGYGYGTGPGYDYYGAGGSYYPPGVNGGTPTYTTNGQWAQAAETYLVQTVGADANTVAAALGKYVTGQPVTGAQDVVIEQAIAFVGYPPQNGPEGYPPNIQTQASSGPPPGGGGGGGSGGGGGGSGTAPKSAPGGLSVTGHSGYADAGWQAVTGATGYDVAFSGPQSTTVHVSGNHAEKVKLKAGRYSVKVRATNSAGAGPWSATRTATVK